MTRFKCCWLLAFVIALAAMTGCVVQDHDPAPAEPEVVPALLCAADGEIISVNNSCASEYICTRTLGACCSHVSLQVCMGTGDVGYIICGLTPVQLSMADLPTEVSAADPERQATDVAETFPHCGTTTPDR